MSTQVFFISDAHLGHKHIERFGGRPIANCKENEEWICDTWATTIRSNKHLVWCLGDMAFNDEALEKLEKLPGRKILIRGNHDDRFKLSRLAEVFENIHSLVARYGWWLTHPPIHPQELRRRHNVHGHVHQQSIPDPRYTNICPENALPIFGSPIVHLDQLKAHIDQYQTDMHA